MASGTLTRSTGEEVVLINKSLSLSGGWDSAFASQTGSSIIDGQGARRGITANAGTTTNIERFTVQNGYTYSGGGRINSFGTAQLNLNRIVLKDNFAANHGGGISGNQVTIYESTIQNNRALYGGGIGNTIRLYLNNSTITGNSAIYGGGIWASGSNYLYSSTVHGNTAVEDGGGLYSFGYPIEIRNSLVDGNVAFNSGQDCFGTIFSYGYSLISRSP